MKERSPQSCAGDKRTLRRPQATLRLLAALAPLVVATVSQAAAPVVAYPATDYAVASYPATGYPTTATYEDVLPPPPTAPTVATAPLVAPVVAAPPAVVTPQAGGTAAGPVISETAAPLADEPPVRWYSPAYWWGPTPWDSGIEVGLNGASGTSDSVSFRTGGFVKRKADDYKFDASLYYNKTQSEGVEIQSNALLDVRYDWLFDDSPWTLFIMNQTFYDEFQAFDLNVNVNAGFGYKWIDEEDMSFTTSFGNGASREFGGPNSEWVAEASFGINYEMKLAENRKFYAKADYFPEWENFDRYRVLADIGMEFELHQPSNTSLKISATDRYDSDPQGVDPHNLNYSMLLIWKK